MPITKGNHAVYNDNVDPDRILKRSIERRTIGNGSRIEYDNVRGHIRSKPAAIGQTESRCRKRRHFSYRLRQRHVRVAGQFKGDVNVDGNLTIDQGAKVIGGVRASTVTIAGELEGNVDAAVRVELLASGVLNGDVKAGSLTVAAGSRMRGNAEFGWDEGKPGSTANRPKVETGTAA